MKVNSYVHKAISLLGLEVIFFALETDNRRKH